MGDLGQEIWATFERQESIQEVEPKTYPPSRWDVGNLPVQVYSPEAKCVSTVLCTSEVYFCLHAKNISLVNARPAQHTQTTPFWLFCWDKDALSHYTNHRAHTPYHHSV